VSGVRVRMPSPLELLRRTWGIVRQEWRPLGAIALILILLPGAFGAITSMMEHIHRGSPLSVIQRDLNMSFGATVVGSAGTLLARMAIAIVVAAAVQRQSIGASGALRRSLRAFLPAVVLALPGAALDALRWLARVEFETRYVLDRFPKSMHYRLGPLDFRPWALIQLGERLVALGVALSLLFLAYAPLALILEGGGPWRAIRTSWARVCSHWLWLCGGTVTLWGLTWLLEWPMRSMPHGGWWSLVGVFFWGIWSPFLMSAHTLQYLQLSDSARITALLSPGPEAPPTELDEAAVPATPDQGGRPWWV